MTTLRHLFRFGLLAAGAASSYATHAHAGALSWQSCQTISDADARLACFDQWANTQQPVEAASALPKPAASALNHPEGKPLASPDLPAPGLTQPVAAEDNCHSTAYSTLSRFYELERGTDCGTLRLRGYHPQSVSLTFADNINQQPSSPSQGAAPEEDRQSKELRLQLSIRSKLASGIFTPANSERLDSLWVGYTQLSYWQVFNADDSRPFRTTDHKPEIFYIYPSSLQLPFNWRLRYSGIGIQHHSNGQSDPLSRSWNQIYLMAGMTVGNFS